MCCWGSGDGTGVRRTGRLGPSFERLLAGLAACRVLTRFFGRLGLDFVGFAGLGFDFAFFDLGFIAFAFASFGFTSFAFALALETFTFKLLEGFFLTFFNASPASCDRSTCLRS